VRDAILAICVRSANDVAVVVAEAISGSESAFARQMTAKAKSLGMASTTFRNASGLPAPPSITTARDVALLARALQVNFPSRYGFFSTRSFKYAGRELRSTNQLLGAIPGVDGMKTGYIRASGYNLVASARRGGRRIIVVVMGEKSGVMRDGHVAALVEEFLPARSGIFAYR
jgi:D-alanyl-D-alanine carboxypeptidase